MKCNDEWEEISGEEFGKIYSEIMAEINNREFEKATRKTLVEFNMPLHKYTLMIEDNKYYKKA